MVHRDHTLDMEIRENYINIYYRGGNIVQVGQSDIGFTASFNENYFKKIKAELPILPKVLETEDESKEWYSAIPSLKNRMDIWLTNRKKDEREFQQLVVRENNFGRIANSTDYYMCDLEYAGVAGQFDLVAVHWPSTASERKKCQNRKIVIIEKKYSEGALKGDSGLVDHITKLDNLIGNSSMLNEFAQEMMILFNQKRKLGLIPDCKHDIESMAEIVDGNVEYILILANHDPASSVLGDELKVVQDMRTSAEIKVAVSNFAGYGFYEENILPLNEFMQKYKRQIYSKA